LAARRLDIDSNAGRRAFRCDVDRFIVSDKVATMNVFWDEIIIFVDTFLSVDLGAPDHIEIIGAACLVALQVHQSLVCI
jgi:hypothetical protein